MDPSRPSEATFHLIQRAQEGNGEALGRLIECYRPGLRAIVELHVGRWLRQRETVEDIVQEVCLHVVQSLADFKWLHAESFPRWLTAIAVNVIRNRARYWKAEVRGRGIGAGPLNDHDSNGQQGNQCELEKEGSVTPLRALAREERYQRLVNAIESLSPDHRQVILLARFEGLPLQEIGVRMGRSRDAVSMLLRRALQRLRVCFGSTDSLGLPSRPLWPNSIPEGAPTEALGETGEADATSPRRPEINTASEVSLWFENLARVRSPKKANRGGLSWSNEEAGAVP